MTQTCPWCQQASAPLEAGGAHLGVVVVLVDPSGPPGSGLVVPSVHAASIADLSAADMAAVLAALTQLSRELQDRTGVRPQVLPQSDRSGHVVFRLESPAELDLHERRPSLAQPTPVLDILAVARTLARQSPGNTG